MYFINRKNGFILALMNNIIYSYYEIMLGFQIFTEYQIEIELEWSWRCTHSCSKQQKLAGFLCVY